MFHFDTRPGIYRCGDGSRGWSLSKDNDWQMRPDCVSGPLYVWVRSSGGAVSAIRTRIGPFEIERAGTELGPVPPAVAADFLMELAQRAEADVAEQALGAAVVGEGVELGQPLLALARDRSRPARVRKSAVFWLGQAASEVSLRGLERLALDDPDLDVREAAVFAISQRGAEEAFPILRDLALSEAHPELRSSAFFWLSQMEDPRVLDFFEKILRP